MSFTLKKLILECERRTKIAGNENKKVFYPDWLLKELRQVQKEVDSEKINYDIHNLKRKP